MTLGKLDVGTQDLFAFDGSLLMKLFCHIQIIEGSTHCFLRDELQ